MHYDELSVRRLAIGGTDPAKPHAIIEANDQGVTIIIQGHRRQAPLVIEARADRTARIVIGDPEHGASVEVEPEGLWLWHSGNTVAALRAMEEGGVLVLSDPDGKPVVRLPGQDA